jgi:transposase
VAETADNPEHGVLRIARFTDGRGRHLLTFEVTWSVITAPERQRMKFDGVGAAADTRAALNASLKTFMNQRVAEPLAYRGAKGAAIRDAVLQSICWMTVGPWASYPAAGAHRCAWSAADRATVAGDTFAISTHSLGSRIAMDALESLGAIDAGEPSGTDHPLTAFRTKAISFFMLSNQLPMLQIGLAPPQETGQADLYCGEDAPARDRRWFDKVSVVAFSDPNDLLSYTIPPDFAAGNLDSRLCAATTNVSVKVAREINLAVTTFASPEAAHLQYEHDAAVLDLMVNGLGAAPPPARCSWLRYTPAAE